MLINKLRFIFTFYVNYEFYKNLSIPQLCACKVETLSVRWSRYILCKIKKQKK